MFCTHCGQQQETGAKFCLACGTPVSPKVPTKASVSAELPEQSEDNAQLVSEAQAGNTEAMFKLGALAKGEGDAVGARRWYEQAAAAGQPGAMTNLGVLAKADGDLVGARRWYEQAAAAGQPVAMFNLGVLAKADGDLVGARRWYEQAAEGGYVGAAQWLAEHTRERPIRAKWALMAAELGHPDALKTDRVLGHPDRERLGNFLEQLAATGETRAYSLLGQIYMDEENFEAAEKWLILLVDAKKEHDAARRLVGCYVAAGKFDEAAPLMDKATRNTAFAYAMHRKDVGDLESFEKWLLYAVARPSETPQSSPEVIELAKLYESQGKVFQAETWYRTAFVAEGNDGNRAQVCEAAADFFERRGNASESRRMRSALKASDELSRRWPNPDDLSDILFEFFLYYCDPAFDNEELMQWQTDHFFALASCRSLPSLKYKTLGWGAILRQKAFHSLIDITNVREAVETMAKEKERVSIYEFIDLVDSTNAGRFKRHDEI